jgi:hypothetical protein
VLVSAETGMLLFFGGMSNGQWKQGKRQGEQQAAHK